MIGLIILCAVLYGSYKTNPDAASFRAFIRPPNSTSLTSSITNFFTDLLTPASTIPEFKRDDYIFFSIVTIADNTETYIGLCGQWFLLSKLQLAGGGKGASAVEENELQLLESIGEAEKNLAIKAKLKKDRKYQQDKITLSFVQIISPLMILVDVTYVSLLIIEMQEANIT